MQPGLWQSAWIVPGPRRSGPARLRSLWIWVKKRKTISSCHPFFAFFSWSRKQSSEKKLVCKCKNFFLLSWSQQKFCLFLSLSLSPLFLFSLFFLEAFSRQSTACIFFTNPHISQQKKTLIFRNRRKKNFEWPKSTKGSEEEKNRRWLKCLFRWRRKKLGKLLLGATWVSRYAWQCLPYPGCLI